MKKYLVLLAVLLLFTASAQADITAAAQLNAPGITVGVDQGSAAEKTVRELLPQAKVAYFTDKFMGYTAVAQGKIDAFVYDRVQMQLAIENGQPGVHLLDEPLGDAVRIAVGISPVSGIPDLENQVNRFIAQIRADGTLDDMYRRWVLQGNSKMPEIPAPKSPKVHLTVGTTGTVPPYSYYEGSDLNGYDIELACRFAAWLDADVSFGIYDFDGIIPAALSGKIDVIMSNLQYLPERSEGLPFSDILFEEKQGIMVRGEARQPAPAWAAYNGRRIGVLTGPLMEDIARKNFPDSEYELYNSYADCITALLTGKIDAYLGDEPGLKSVHAEQPKIDYIHDPITSQDYSFAFRRDDPRSAALCEELNAFLALCRQDGTIQELEDIWFGKDEERKAVDMSGLTGENGTVRVVTTSTDMPFSYIKDGKNAGYDIDLVVRFCRHAGYRLELGDVDFAARIPAVQSGKFDFSTDMNVTPERQEQVLFSDPTSNGSVVLAILTGESEPQPDVRSGEMTLHGLDGRRIGVQTGSTFDAIVLETLPNAVISYFNSYSDMAAALEAHKIDGFPGDEPVIRLMAAENPRLTVLSDRLDSFEFGFVLPKTETGEALKAELDAWIISMQESGELERIVRKWTEGPEADKTVPDYSAFPASRGTLKMATEGAYAPMNYYRENEVVGMEIDLAARFCEAGSYGLAVEAMNFDGILPAVQTGKADFAAAAFLSLKSEKKAFFSPLPITQAAQ